MRKDVKKTIKQLIDQYFDIAEIEISLASDGYELEKVENGYLVSNFDNTYEIDNVLEYLKKAGLHGEVIERRRKDGPDWVITDTNADYYTIEDYQKIIGNDNNFVIAGDDLKGYIEQEFESRTTMQRRLDIYEIRSIIEELEPLVTNADAYDGGDVLVIEDNIIVHEFELNKAYIYHSKTKFELAILIEVEND